MIRAATAGLRLALLVGTLAGVDAADAADDGEASAKRRGEALFQYYCATCHGTAADGRGRAALLYDPKPSNLRRSVVNDTYRALIIRNGGETVGRSGAMPPWREELSESQTHDVIVFLRSIASQ